MDVWATQRGPRGQFAPVIHHSVMFSHIYINKIDKVLVKLFVNDFKVVIASVTLKKAKIAPFRGKKSEF